MQNLEQSVEIPDVYYLETLEQLQTLADTFRYRMIILLAQPKTCAQLGRALEIDRAKAHYHLKQLEKAGLVKLHRVDESQAITEKYYIVIARFLDFTRLIPKDDIKTNEVTLASYKSIAGFLTTMLDVSRDRIVDLYQTEHVMEGMFFDLETKLTKEQFETYKTKLRTIRNELIEMRKENEKEGKRESITVHSTLYFSPKGSKS